MRGAYECDSDPSRSDGGCCWVPRSSRRPACWRSWGAWPSGSPACSSPWPRSRGACCCSGRWWGSGRCGARGRVRGARRQPVPGARGVLHAVRGGGLAAVDLVFALVVVATGLDVLRHGLPVLAAGPLTLPLALLGLALGAGVVTGYAHGGGRSTSSMRAATSSTCSSAVRGRQPRAHAPRAGRRDRVRRRPGDLQGVLGLLTVGTGRGRVVDGSTITFYEPVANFLMLVAVLGIFALVVSGARDRLPLWALLGSPLMIASLALSLRRSFWIGLALGLVLVLVLGTRRSAGGCWRRPRWCSSWPSGRSARSDSRRRARSRRASSRSSRRGSRRTRRTATASTSGRTCSPSCARTRSPASASPSAGAAPRGRSASSTRAAATTPTW